MVDPKLLAAAELHSRAADAIADAAIEISRRLYDACAPLLAGRGPEVQGAALADLTAIWLAGHPAEVREELLAMHVEAVRDLIEINAKIRAAGEPDE